MRRWQQRAKWIVYALLLLDFALYFIDDRRAAAHVLGASSNWADVARAYVTSIDLAAWFSLILLFELETGTLADRPWRGGAKAAVRGVRLACYALILHTSFAYDVTLGEFQQARPLPAAGACAVADGGWSFLRNREYTVVTAANCESLGAAGQLYHVGDESVLTDLAGLREGLVLAWTDLIESVAWLLVVFASELAVWLRRSRAAGGAALALIGRGKTALYALILAIAAYWGSKGQFLYLWDELIWVCGFLIIDDNIRRLTARAR